VSRLQTLPRRAMRRVRRRLSWRLHARDSIQFDRKYGIDTSGVANVADLTVREGDPASGHEYVSTQPRLARWWLSALPEDPSPFTFVDMGSGKGRVLVHAAERGFGRTVGIEFAQELHETALANAHAVRSRGLSIEPLLGDAGGFEFPDEPLVVHFNNPFAESVMERVVANLTRSYERRPRAIVLVYQQLVVENHPTRNLELLDDVPFLSGRKLPLPDRIPDRWMLDPFMVRIYESPEARRSRGHA
jgi:SAM-dependent methyltransferase